MNLLGMCNNQDIQRKRILKIGNVNIARTPACVFVFFFFFPSLNSLMATREKERSDTISVINFEL